MPRPPSVGVTTVVQVGCDVNGSRWAADTAAAHPSVHATVALHPNEAPRIVLGDPDGWSRQGARPAGGDAALDEALAEIDRLAALPQVRGVGETGLDHFRTGPEGMAAQERSFRAHIEIAKRHGKALVIHDREAHDDVLRILDEEGAPERTVFHCYSGDAEMARICAENGYFMSFAGNVTFKNAQPLRDALAVAPLELVLVETDAPFLTPAPYRGRPNAPYLIPVTLRAMAAVKGLDEDALAAAVAANTARAFATDRQRPRGGAEGRAGNAPRHSVVAPLWRVTIAPLGSPRRSGPRSVVVSNSPYGTYEPQETLVALGTYEPPPGPHPHADTYRPGYESMETQPAWPVPEALLPRPSAPAADPAPQTAGRAEARRAARRRKRPERPETLRRLLPQALVVAFLAGGTTAFVAADKAVQLSVDGRPRTLHTFADDVSELLADEGVDVGAARHRRPRPRDRPGQRRRGRRPLRPARPPHPRRAAPPGVDHRGHRRRRPAPARRPRRGRRTSPPPARAASPATASRWTSAPNARVTVMADGRERTIRTNAATVREAVDEAGISLHGQDTTSVPQDSFPRDGQTITVMRITGTREVREEVIAYVVERILDPTLFRGTEVVERAGRRAPGASPTPCAPSTASGRSRVA